MAVFGKAEQLETRPRPGAIFDELPTSSFVLAIERT